MFSISSGDMISIAPTTKTRLQIIRELLPQASPIRTTLPITAALSRLTSPPASRTYSQTTLIAASVATLRRQNKSMAESANPATTMTL